MLSQNAASLQRKYQGQYRFALWVTYFCDLLSQKCSFSALSAPICNKYVLVTQPAKISPWTGALKLAKYKHYRPHRPLCILNTEGVSLDLENIMQVYKVINRYDLQTHNIE